MKKGLKTAERVFWRAWREYLRISTAAEVAFRRRRGICAVYVRFAWKKGYFRGDRDAIFVGDKFLGEGASRKVCIPLAQGKTSARGHFDGTPNS